MIQIVQTIVEVFLLRYFSIFFIFIFTSAVVLGAVLSEHASVEFRGHESA